MNSCSRLVKSRGHDQAFKQDPGNPARQKGEKFPGNWPEVRNGWEYMQPPRQISTTTHRRRGDVI